MVRIVGTAYKALKSRVKKYAKEDRPVLFVGETGSGKELFARYYMENNGRKGEKRTVNCAAFSKELLRSEIFGHVKGAFTGAVKHRHGLISASNTGILFLDELGSASPDFQEAILRVSERNSFCKLGSDEEITDCDTLIIGATNSLSRIRADLKYRFHILPVPSLQQCDIPILAEHFLKRPLRRDVLEELMADEYPGNVRELEGACFDLKIDRGDAIFAKRSAVTDCQTATFDYERFEREYSTWNRYLQPLLDKHDLDLKYVYQPIDETKMRLAGNKDFMLTKPPYPYSQRASEEDLFTRLRMLELMHVSREMYLEDFYLDTKRSIEEGNLPYYLEELRLEFSSEHPPQPIKPDLSPLFNLKLTEAMAHFELAYLEYHLQRCQNNRSRAAEAAGLPTSKSLTTRLTRIRNRINQQEK